MLQEPSDEEDISGDTTEEQTQTVKEKNKKEDENTKKNSLNKKPKEVKKTKSKKSENSKKSTSPYILPDEYNPKLEAKNKAIKTERKPWNKIIEFSPVVIKFPKNDLTLLRDIFRSTINVAVVYLQVRYTKYNFFIIYKYYNRK